MMYLTRYEDGVPGECGTYECEGFVCVYIDKDCGRGPSDGLNVRVIGLDASQAVCMLFDAIEMIMCGALHKAGEQE